MLTCLVLIKQLKLVPFFILVTNDFFLANDKSHSRQHPKIQPPLWWSKNQGFFGIKNNFSSYFQLLTLKHPKITKQNQPNLKNINWARPNFSGTFRENNHYHRTSFVKWNLLTSRMTSFACWKVIIYQLSLFCHFLVTFSLFSQTK